MKTYDMEDLKPGAETLDLAKRIMLTWFADMNFVIWDGCNAVVHRKGQTWWIGQGGEEW